MKKLLKIFLVFILMIAFSMNLSVFAAEDNKSTENNTTAATTTTEETATNNASSTKSSTQVTSVAPADEKDLSISDILNILLIATGVVIILLAIAIFIKLK